MKKKQESKKMLLSVEKVRPLTKEQLAAVFGGYMPCQNSTRP